jgi:DNA processing protein
MIGVGTTGAAAGAADHATGSARRPGYGITGRERAAWIALAAVPRVGQAGFASLLRAFGSAQATLEQPDDRVALHLPRADESTQRALASIRQRGVEETAARLEAAAAAVGGRAVTSRDSDYPARLARLPLQPPVLYASGAISCLAAECVAVVGTRRPTGYGRAVAAEIADELARAGVCVISGLALGVDGVAHRSALDAGGVTAAVLPSPIDRIYPPRHRALAEAIVAAGGVLLSESPPGRTTGKPDFARRNRIVSGLADAVVIVEAPDRSGALLTAAAASEQGRDLMAVPGPIDSVASRGCNRLIADHQAEIITSAVALVQRLGLRPAGRTPLAVGLSEPEGLVLGSLFQRSASIEELMDRTRLGTPALASVLTLLEARGLVTSYGGATFHPTVAARRAGLVP